MQNPLSEDTDVLCYPAAYPSLAEKIIDVQLRFILTKTIKHHHEDIRKEKSDHDMQNLRQPELANQQGRPYLVAY
jgi:hypothetical protein